MSLSKKHREELAASGVSDQVAEERGYQTVKKATVLREFRFSDRQSRLGAGLLIPIHGPDKEVVAHQFKPDSPRRDKGGKVVKYESPQDSRVRLDVPVRAAADLADPTVPLIVTEGAKKADAATSAGLCCVSLSGVWNWRSRDDWDVSIPLPEWDQVALAGREVFICFDSDVMVKPQVEQALQRLSVFLLGQGSNVKWLLLPSGKKSPVDGVRSKVGLDDFLAADNNTIEDLWDLAHLPRLAEVNVGNPPARLIDEAIAVLAFANKPPEIFQRDGVLSERIGDRVLPMDDRRLRYRLTRAASWVRVGKDEQRRSVDPPESLLRNVSVAREQWPFPELERVVHVPVFNGDGDLQTEPGYHAATKTLYIPPPDLTVPAVSANPSTEEVQKAKALIHRLLHDFHFVDDADRAHAWALLLQPFVRSMVWGETPLFVVMAHEAGTGKGTLAKAALAPAVGEISAMPEPHGNEEMKKTLTAALQAAQPVVMFDNVDRFVSYPSLAAALTTHLWQDRILGTSLAPTLTIACTWVMTGNNPNFSGEMARRVVPIRLKKQPANYAYDLSLPGWALKNRADLIWAACTVTRAWVAAGKPEPADDVPAFKSFGPWRRVLGGILALAGAPGFLSNTTDFHDNSSEEAATLRLLFEEYDVRPFLARDAADLIYDDPEAAAEVFASTNLPEGGRGLSVRMGRWLQRHRGHVVEGHTLTKAREKRGSQGFPWHFYPGDPDADG